MAKFRDPKVQRARPYAGTRRVTRSPAYPFQLRTKPFQIQPFLLSPVLPGETLSNLVLQSRVVSKPLKHALMGWWCEYYFFYVKLKDIEFHLETDFVDQMVTDPANYNPAALRAPADPKYYHAAGGTPWLKYALQTIVEYYFRDQGEDWDVATLDGLPLAQIAQRNWTDSLTLEDKLRQAERDVDMDMNADGKITVQEAMNAQEHWQALRDAGLEQMDYEDWIRTFGVQVDEVPESFNLHKPELIRYSREWQYPNNTIDPVTGTPSSAVSFINAFRADKDRMFREPGFIVGLNVIKPKIYMKDQSGGLAGFMETLENWLPALSHSQYEKGFKGFAEGTGPLAGKSFTGDQGYWVDIRDLLLYGDQFLNFAPDDAANALDVITADGGRRYVSAADINNLFKSPAANWFEQDGVVNLSIKGRQRDRTPTGQYL